MSTNDTTDPVRIAFMCVQNAGRSQMSTAFAERERRRRGLEDRIEILTGGTDPADAVHEEVIEVMDEVGLDLSERKPREITVEELNSCEYVATMGCSTLDVGDVDDGVDVHDWALTDPDGKELEDVREIRDEIERKVAALFDEIESST
ncbi:low molecular weight phosphatase family protein [Natronomonas gomsonensis]|jgi:arsenate reductase|uniref:low molecular weight phosphatase family protein n=1 Tax=Natronomonas gomsonensis TaxID=1046043 RepID=UPI0020CA3DEF|nr:low molecular weight phosphatase family protein [Natronomonas gomsonensis]